MPLKKVKDDLASPDHFKDEEYVIKCVCANEEDDGNTVLCEGCDTWQHINCYYRYPEKVADVHNCTDCVPRIIKAQKVLRRKCFVESGEHEAEYTRLANSNPELSLSLRDKASFGAIIDSVLAVSDLNRISERRIHKAIEETVGYNVSHYEVSITGLEVDLSC